MSIEQGFVVTRLARTKVSKESGWAHLTVRKSASGGIETMKSADMALRSVYQHQLLS